MICLIGRPASLKLQYGILWNGLTVYVQNCFCYVYIHLQSSLWRSVVALEVALDGPLDTSAVDKLL